MAPPPFSLGATSPGHCRWSPWSLPNRRPPPHLPSTPTCRRPLAHPHPSSMPPHRLLQLTRRRRPVSRGPSPVATPRHPEPSRNSRAPSPSCRPDPPGPPPLTATAAFAAPRRQLLHADRHIAARLTVFSPPILISAPDARAQPRLLHGAAQWLPRHRPGQRGRKLLNEMLDKDVVARTAMLSGSCQAGRIAEARVLFDEMPKRNVVSWTAMISGYAQNGQVNLARKLFDVMPERDGVLWTAMLVWYIQAGHVGDADELFNAMPEHPVAACNAMMVSWVRERGMVDAAKAVFERMRERDDGTWSAMIKAYEQNEFLMEALSTFREML